VSEAMLLHYKRRVECHSNHVSISFRSGCVLLEGGVSAKFFKALLNRKKSIISIDSGGRETYFGPINLGQNFLKIFEFVYFRIFENFFITDSRSTDHDPCSFVGIFDLPTSELEDAISLANGRDRGWR